MGNGAGTMGYTEADRTGVIGAVVEKRLRLREAAVAVRNEKTVARCVDRIEEEQQSRPACKPASDHPWRRSWKPHADGVVAG